MSISRRRLLILAGSGVISTLLAGCSIPNLSLFDSSSAKVLSCIVGINSPFYEMIVSGAQAEAKKQGVLLQVQAPTQWDVAIQTQLVRQAIENKVDGLIISPTDNNALVTPLKRAADEGIKIVTVDTFIGSNGDYSKGPVTFPITYVGSDNVLGGRMAGSALVKMLGGQGKIYVQSTARGTSATDEREEGFKEILSSTNGAVQIMGTGYDGGDVRTATQQTLAMLAQVPDIDGIFGTGDYSTKGVMIALEQAQKIGQIKVVRFDASVEAMSDLRSGKIDLVISQQPEQMGMLGVDYVLRAISGDRSLQKRVTTGFVEIDRQNMDTQAALSAVYR